MNLYFDVLFNKKGQKMAMGIVCDGSDKLYIKWRTTAVTDIRPKLFADNGAYYFKELNENTVWIDGVTDDWKSILAEWVSTFDDPIFITDNAPLKAKVLADGCGILNKSYLPIIDLNNLIYYKNKSMSYYDILTADKDIVTGMMTNRTIVGDPKNPLHHAEIIKILFKKFWR